MIFKHGCPVCEDRTFFYCLILCRFGWIFGFNFHFAVTKTYLMKHYLRRKKADFPKDAGYLNLLQLTLR